jgi:hypothetical protein
MPIPTLLKRDKKKNLDNSDYPTYDRSAWFSVFPKMFEGDRFGAVPCDEEFESMLAGFSLKKGADFIYGSVEMITKVGPPTL